MNPNLTPEQRVGIDAALFEKPACPHLSGETSHADFLAWARINVPMPADMLQFLESRNDCAGSSPAAWTRLVHVVRTPWFIALLPSERYAIIVGLIGIKPYNRFIHWCFGGALAGILADDEPTLSHQ